MAAAFVLLVSGALWIWRVQRPTGKAMAGTPAVATHPLENRLLTAAARAPAAPGPYLELAEEYAASDRLASAVWAYEEAGARAPGDREIRLKMAGALRSLGYIKAAEREVRGVIAGGGAGVASARLELAELLLATGRASEVLPLLKTAGPEGEAARGRAYEALGDLTAAARTYGQAGKQGQPEGFERLAWLELRAGRLAAARQALRDLGRLRAPGADDLLLIAAVHAQAGSPRDLDAALAALLRCVRLQPRNAEFYYQAGLLFLRKGDRKAALDQFERAVKLDSDHASARERLAAVRQAIGSRGRAHRERAAYYTLKDQPDRALAELRRAAAAGYPDDHERTLIEVRTLSELQQLPGAVKAAQEGLKRHPRSAELQLQLGLLYQLLGSRGALERLCRDWQSQEPASGGPDWLLGRRAMNDTRPELAIRHFEAACAREPQNAEYCAALGRAYLALPTPENNVRARRWLEKAVALNPRSAVAQQDLANLLVQAGDLEAGRRHYLQSLDVQSRQTVVLNHLVQVSTRLSRPGAAQLFAGLARDEEERGREYRRLARQVRENPTASAARLEFARFLVRYGELPAALNQVERAAQTASAPARQVRAALDRLLRVQEG